MVSNLTWAGFLVLVTLSVSFAEPSWKFIVTSDSQGRDDGLNALILGEIASEIVKHDVDLVLFSGDLVYGNDENLEGRLTWWREVMEPVYDANIAVYPCRGNHDSSGSKSIWQKVFSDLPDNGPAGEKHMTYSVIHKNALIVALDEYSVERHQVNQSWLDGQFAANRQPLVFVFGHTPAFQAYHDDCLDDYPEKRDIFWAGLRNAGARTYFCGHDHFYDHARVDDGDGDPNNDIHQYIVGTAGANFYSFTPPYDGNNGDYTVEQWYHQAWYGYVLVEVDGLDVTLSWMERYMISPDGEWGYQANEVWTYTVPPARMTVVSPNGGESLVAGSECEIRWETNEDPNIEYVLIEYSTDNGQNWSQVDTVTNLGAYEWIVPMVDSNECLMRVSDLNDPMTRDTSNAVFTIFRCQGPVAGDVNGDCYVDSLDLAALVPHWLECGNPFDTNCALE